MVNPVDDSNYVAANLCCKFLQSAHHLVMDGEFTVIGCPLDSVVGQHHELIQLGDTSSAGKCTIYLVNFVLGLISLPK